MTNAQKKVIVITGASSGIGKATAIRLLNADYIVYGAARRVEEMEDLKDLGGIPVKLDITKHDQISQFIEKVIEEQGKIDVLFNNAGFGLYGPVEETPLDLARYQFEVNLFGHARMTQLVIPYMRERQSGLIINTSSVGGKIYTPFGAWYHATKHAVEGWSDSLRLELKPFGINVVILEPGFIGTQFYNVVLDKVPKQSLDGPYSEAIKRMKETSQEMEEDDFSPPSVVADVVLKAINAKKPKTRYKAGKYAKLLIFIRKLFSDNRFDKLITKRFM
ncbi:MAG: 3-oxoacyl-[acyl-carrier protein] reductase [Promethearchaeota archaeon]|nr:MAG: 3-oxoacyl-[acyl-carrier protein] reductase [Candidatus Lokiarchaeota archaeon]